MLKITLRIAIALALLSPLSPATSALSAAGPPAQFELPSDHRPGVPSVPRVWLDRDGEPYPFQTDEEAMELLATADVVGTKQLGIGVTRSERLDLEADGLRFRAIFKTFHDIRQRVRLGDGTFVMHLRDTYRNEAAAYELGRHLGIDWIPPTIIRRIGGREGSLQLWIENAIMEMDRRDRGLAHPDPELWRRKLSDMRVFDNLINNIDRNLGDMLITPEWHLWLVDHSRAFGRERHLPTPQAISRCSVQLYEAIQALDQETAREILSPYMGRFEIRSLLQRRDAILEMLDERIVEVGREHVLFDWETPAPVIEATPEEVAN